MFFFFFRCIDANFKTDSCYRKYSPHVPKFLVDQPSDLIKHGLTKITLVNSMNLRGGSVLLVIEFPRY